MSGLLPRDHFQRRNGSSGQASSNEREYQGYRDRSPSPSRNLLSRSRSPAREPRSTRFASTHSYDFSPPSLPSFRHPSYDLSRPLPRRPSERSHHTESTSHNARDSAGWYMGHRIWSTNHGNHSPEWPGPESTYPFLHSRRQREAPCEYGDDELPYYSSASAYADIPSPTPSYTGSHGMAPSHGPRPPPSFRSVGSRGSQGYGQPRQLLRQMPPTRRESRFYPSDLPGRNYYIDKNGHYER